jgi:hypothetical protein
MMTEDYDIFQSAFQIGKHLSEVVSCDRPYKMASLSASSARTPLLRKSAAAAATSPAFLVDDDHKDSSYHTPRSALHYSHPDAAAAAAAATTKTGGLGLIRVRLRDWKRRFHRIPRRYKFALLLLWIGWKLVVAAIFVYFLQSGFFSGTTSLQSSSPLKVLYIVTSLAEYNSGRRDTIKGQDRLAQVLVPVLVDSLHSLLEARDNNHNSRIQVDVYLVLAYTLRPEREQFIRSHLPASVGLQIWDDACPLGYDPPLPRQSPLLDPTAQQFALQNNTRSLARQHRYIVRDYLLEYDFFIAMEDDMRVTADHVLHFAEMSHALLALQQQQQQQQQEEQTAAAAPPLDFLFFGPMTRAQWDRLVPGFVRVEVLLNEDEHGAQTELDPIPLDFSFLTDDDTTISTAVGTTTTERHFNATTCCHIPQDLFQQFPDLQQKEEHVLPGRPAADKVVIWETNIKALSVRQLPPSSNIKNNNKIWSLSPSLDWVALLPGPGKRLAATDTVAGYWSGQDGAFGANAVRPSGGDPHIVAQQGGWMATREQVVRLQRLCQGSFLPPFDEPVYRGDGQESMNVEFWSGGYQLFTGVKGGCNMQRVISLHPDHFSKHFLYHVANNKQRQLSRQRMLRADHFFGQLNSVKKAAERSKKAILGNQ